MSAPFLVVVAGPNGSGKTTLTDGLRGRGIDLGVYINADEIALTIPGPPSAASAREAQRRADTVRENCLEARSSMTFETVMSHPSKIDFMVRARRAGFAVRLYFVATEDPEANLARVRARVRLGGHDVPEEKVRARYRRSLGLLGDAVTASHEGAIFDNTSPIPIVGDFVKPMQMILSYANVGGVLTVRNRVAEYPLWVRGHFPFPA